MSEYDQIRESLFIEHFKLRTNPKSYIPHLQEQMKYFRENNVLAKPGEVPIQTNEGEDAYLEAIEFLKYQPAMSELIMDPHLTKAAQDHVNDIGPKGAVSHEGADGKNVSDRIERYIEWEGICGENIEFGTKNPVDIMINFIVDDGLEKRPHRNHLFNDKFNYFGIAVGEHKTTEIVVVIDFTSRVRQFGTHHSNLYNYIVTKDEQPAEGKQKNLFQLEDADAPDDTESVNIKKLTKTIEGEDYQVTKKCYLLKDGTTHIVEVVEKMIK
jgi:uncharacterized protein YkwD